MNVKQIKNEIRKLDRIEKTEIYRWIGAHIHAANLLSGIGVYRSAEIRAGGDQTCRVIS
jgi:hypothetical protein